MTWDRGKPMHTETNRSNAEKHVKSCFRKIIKYVTEIRCKFGRLVNFV